MKKLRIKYLLTVICMLAAGICYSCGKGTTQVDLDGQTLVMDLQAEQTSQEAGVQNGLISAKTEAGEDSPDEPEAGSGEEPLPWQTESVRFYVHICGEVVNPGVYEMEPGSRIFHVVEAAGGFTGQAASDYLNMAQETADGMKITVPSREETEGLEVFGPGAGGQSGKKGQNTGTGVASEDEGKGKDVWQGSPWIEMPEGTGQEILGLEPSGKIDLNTATKEELMTLRGIGEARAADIIRYREEQGPFQTIDEVMNISGIKEAAFEKIKDDITV